MKQAPTPWTLFFPKSPASWKYFDKLPLSSPSFRITRRASQAIIQMTVCLGKGYSWQQRDQDSSALALKSPAPDLWFLASFVEAAWLEWHFLLPPHHCTAGSSWVWWGGGGECQSPGNWRGKSALQPRLLSGWPWASYLTSLSFHFLFCETDIKTSTLPSLTDGCENKARWWMWKCSVNCKVWYNAKVLSSDCVIHAPLNSILHDKESHQHQMHNWSVPLGQATSSPSYWLNYWWGQIFPRHRKFCWPWSPGSCHRKYDKEA